MVAALVRMRLLVLRNTVRSSTMQLVALIIGALYAAGALAAAIAGLFFLSTTTPETVRTAVVIGGALVLLGWAVLPIVATGVDETLEPAKLAGYPIPLHTLMTGMTIGGFIGIPGAATTLAALATAGSWIHLPGVALLALPCGVLGALTCVVASRAVAAAATGLSAGRRFKEARGVLVLVPLLLLGPIIAAVGNGLAGASVDFDGLARTLAWTPLGAAWAIPSSVAAGVPLAALGQLLVALATLGVLGLLWRWGLARALVTPPQGASGRRVASGLGLFGRVGSGAVGAVAARCLTYWFRDPRYLRQLIVVPAMPALLWFYAQVNEADGFFLALGPVIAFLLSLSIVTDLSYDSTAFALHLAKGVPGSADRAGRVVAVLVFALPLTVVGVVVSGIVVGPWSLTPALLGLSLGMLGTGLGAGSIASTFLVMPVPAPGDNPFRSRPGANIGRQFQVLLVWGVVAVACLPEFVLFGIASATGSVVLGWVLAVVGLALGALCLVLGVRFGGQMLDQRGPSLLSELRAVR